MKIPVSLLVLFFGLGRVGVLAGHVRGGAEEGRRRLACTRKQKKDMKPGCRPGDPDYDKPTQESLDEAGVSEQNGAHGYYDANEPHFDDSNLDDTTQGKYKWYKERTKRQREVSLDDSEDLPDAGYNGNWDGWHGGQVDNVPQHQYTQAELKERKRLAKLREAAQQKKAIDRAVYKELGNESDEMSDAEKAEYLKLGMQWEKKVWLRKWRNKQKMKKAFAHQDSTMERYANDYDSFGELTPAAKEKRKREKEARKAKRKQARGKLNGSNKKAQKAMDKDAEKDFGKRDQNVDNYFRDKAFVRNYVDNTGIDLNGDSDREMDMEKAFQLEKRRQEQDAKVQDTIDRYFNFEKYPENEAKFKQTVDDAIKTRGVSIKDETVEALAQKARTVDKLLDNPYFV